MPFGVNGRKLTDLLVTDMVFEDDSKLIGLLMRYSETHELEELKSKIVEYISTQTQDIGNEFKNYQTEKATEE
jgi:protocatechuate 3,4-dioxygenase beta subunit